MHGWARFPRAEDASDISPNQSDIPVPKLYTSHQRPVRQLQRYHTTRLARFVLPYNSYYLIYFFQSKQYFFLTIIQPEQCFQTIQPSFSKLNMAKL